MRALLLCPAVLPLPALAQAQAQEVIATDGRGVEISLPAPAGRVVCLATECLHDLYVLGVLPHAIGPEYDMVVATDPSLFGEAAAGLPVLPWSDGHDIEALAALAPDLVVGWAGIEDYLPPEVMEEIAPLFVRAPVEGAGTPEVLARDLLALGTLLGRREEAEAFAARAGDRLAAYEALRPEGGPRVATVRLGLPESGVLWVAPGCPAVLGRLAGCAHEGADWLEMGAEGLLALDADVLVAEDWGSADDGIAAPADWAGVPLWTEVRAVAEGRIHHVPVSDASPTSTLALTRSLDALMPLLYPEAFPAPLGDEQVAEALRE